MGSKTVAVIIDSEKPYEQVKSAVRSSLSYLGGSVQENGDQFLVTQGTNNVNFAFNANFKAMINIRQVAPTRYEVFGTINWSPNGLFWVCFIVGFFLFGILWIDNLLYLFIDPTNAYTQALSHAQNLLR